VFPRQPHRQPPSRRASNRLAACATALAAIGLAVGCGPGPAGTAGPCTAVVSSFSGQPAAAAAAPCPRPTVPRACLPTPGARRLGTVLLIHGGGWVFGSPDMLSAQCRRLAVAGFRALRPAYPLGDIRAAFAAMRALAGAERRAGHRPLYAAGISAGGAMAVMLAAEGRVDGAYAWAPPTDLVLWASVPGVNLSAAGAASLAVRRQCSPARNLTARRAPLLVEHAPADALVPFAQSQQLLGLYGPAMTLRARPDASWGAFSGHGGDGRPAGSGTGTCMLSWLVSQARHAAARPAA
jgi:acetyl esterase